MHAEAEALLEARLDALAKRPYTELVALIDQPPLTETITGKAGSYQLEVVTVWDRDAKAGVVRLLGSVDDGGWRAFVPLSRDRLIDPPTRPEG